MLVISKENRKALFDQLEPNSIAILPSAKIYYRSNSVEYPFRQDSDFYYLTAFKEPNSIAIFIKPDHKPSNNKFILFHQRVDLAHKTWKGDLASSEEVIKLFNADLSYYIDQIDHILPELLADRKIIFYPQFKDVNLFNDYYCKIIKYVLRLERSDPKIIYKDLLTIIHALRVLKSDLEVNNIRYANKISSAAHQHIMKYVSKNNCLTEKHIYAEFYRYCLQNGCDDMAYNPIVAAGKNACVLHYTKNTDIIKNNDLLLLDAGAEYNYYIADITRVFPISGKFSSEQAAIYNLVLLAQKEAIKKIKPGLIWSEIQKEIIEFLVEGLIELKILQGNKSDLIAKGAYKDFYMHNSGHFIGLDVHDVGSYKIGNHYRPLEAGMVLTVEPGLYFANRSGIASKWHGIGIRIEDNILVTNNGYENLTTVVKEIADIEYLMLN